MSEFDKLASQLLKEAYDANADLKDVPKHKLCDYHFKPSSEAEYLAQRCFLDEHMVLDPYSFDDHGRPYTADGYEFADDRSTSDEWKVDVIYYKRIYRTSGPQRYAHVTCTFDYDGKLVSCKAAEEVDAYKTRSFPGEDQMGEPFDDVSIGSVHTQAAEKLEEEIRTRTPRLHKIRADQKAQHLADNPLSFMDRIKKKWHAISS